MSVLAMIMFVLLSIISSTQRIWKQTSTRIDAFRGARSGFESMTRRLSQATLNTYWDYDHPSSSSDPIQTPTKYVRKSELRFICGVQADGVPLLLADSATVAHPSHAVFFQAPLGFVSTTGTTYAGMENLLNTCGYYIEWAADNDSTLPNTQRPGFLGTQIQVKRRCRLMELCQPSDVLNIYNLTSGNNTYGNKYSGASNSDFQWFQGTSGNPNWYPNQSHIIAENVIGLFFLPKLSTTDEQAAGADITSGTFGNYLLFRGRGNRCSFTYNSAPYSWPPPVPPPSAAIPMSLILMANQLPPLVKVTMVAIDEDSAARLDALAGNVNPWTFLNLPKTGAYPAFALADDGSGNATFQTDLNNLTQALQKYHLNYRVFTTEVTIRGAKWSSK